MKNSSRCLQDTFIPKEIQPKKKKKEMRSRKRNRSKSTQSRLLVFQSCMRQDSQTCWQLSPICKASHPWAHTPGWLQLLWQLSVSCNFYGFKSLRFQPSWNPQSFWQKARSLCLSRFTEILYPDTVIPAPSADWSADFSRKPQMFPWDLQGQTQTAASAS